MAPDLSTKVDASDVMAVHSSTTASTDAIDFHVQAAETVVDNRLDANNFQTKDYRRIVLYVACHMLASQSPTETEGDVGGANFAYEGVQKPQAAGADLETTRYGRRAITLDPTGNLESADDPVAFEAIGPGG